MSRKIRFSKESQSSLNDFFVHRSPEQPKSKAEENLPAGILSAFRTDVGKVRANNQDAPIVSEKLRLYGVADGMGGHKGGEVASTSARDDLLRELEGKTPSVAALSSAIEEVNRQIYHQQEHDDALTGMGTTLSVLWMSDNFVYIGHVGDSRVYLLRDGEFKQMTLDHSLVEQLDACAAPGGKSCLMAEMMQGTGRVQAWELHPHRADLIAAQVQRLGLENVRPMTRDALKHREELDGTMDIVLLDAPCSGLGVMSEKPDVKYRVTAQSVDELVQLQSNLLDAVCPYVKKGGTLVYSTCSVLKDENVRQAEKFLARHPEFELLPLPETIPASVRQYETTGLQLLPQRDGIEGFYMCRMRRKKA